MVKRITEAQLKRAVKKSPRFVEDESKAYIIRGLSEYKRVVVQERPWRVGQSGGGVPRDTGNLRERHVTKISAFKGSFGVSEKDVRYAGYVHNGTKHIEARPWLDYAEKRAAKSVEKHYRVFMDNLLDHIAN